MISLDRNQIQQVFEHAQEADPAECCGLLGGSETGRVITVYRLRNIAENQQAAYEAAPEDLFYAQRQMRERGEQLLAIYHSHPRSGKPEPSETDVRLAYYPSAIYLIVGLAGSAPIMRAFSISEREQRWEEVEYEIADE
jgi:[CysO sulfur-carrier protein]-S-L-cysteine hydrolase